MNDCLAWYRGRRVLITGLTGFKGSWLGTWLTMLGAEVAGLSLPISQKANRLSPWLGIEEQFTCESGDIRDPQVVEAVFARRQPEIVFHLAAQALVRASYRDPAGTFATNVLGTAHVLDAARRCSSVRAVVNVTSDKCYENREWAWGYRESDPMGGHDPYSASKGCAELVAASFRRSFCSDKGPYLGSARAGNVIGGGDWSEDRLIPDIVRGILAGEPVIIRRPESVRPWQHVLEPLSGYLMLGQRLATQGEPFADGWNFGPTAIENYPVRRVTAEIVRHWGRGTVVEQVDPHAPHEAHTLRLDSSKAFLELGWRPRLSTSECFQWTVDWYKAWSERLGTPWDLTRQQIEQYMER
jgi:CDP-glucose 4,6-dehydratase